jgi:hypothetical protein
MSEQATQPVAVKLSKQDRELLALMASDSANGHVTYYPGRWHPTNSAERTRYRFERWQPTSSGKLYTRVTAPLDRLCAAGLVDFPSSTKPCRATVTAQGHAWLAEYRRQQALKNRVTMSAAQVDLVRRFAGLPTESNEVPVRQSTYDGLEARGWIEKCDEWPFHRTTTAGLAALRSHEGWA